MSDSPPVDTSSATAMDSTIQGGTPGQAATRPGPSGQRTVPSAPREGGQGSPSDYWGKVFSHEADTTLPEDLLRGDDGSWVDATATDPAKDVERAPEGKEQPSHEDPKIASKLAIVAKAERKLREQGKAMEAREARVAQLEAQQKLLGENPYAYAKSVGLTLDKLIPLALADDTAAPDPIQSKISELEEKLNKRDAADAAARAAAEAKADEEGHASAMATVNEYLTANAEQYELVAETGSQADVFGLILADWTAQGGPPESRTPMALDKAARLVEEQLMEEAQRFTKSKKIRALIGGDPQGRPSETSNENEEEADPFRVASAADRDWAGHREAQAKPVARYGEESVTPPFSPTLTNSRTAASSAGSAPPARLASREADIKAVTMKLFGRT